MIGINDLYEFSQNDAMNFSKYIMAEAKSKGNELVFKYCPYCHGGRHRDKNTFSINLQTGLFNCQRSSCEAKGNMITIARDFDFPLNDDVSRYLEQNEYSGRFRSFVNEHKQSTDKAIEYLKSRGIPEEITKRYEITTKDGDDNVMVFPFADENDELWFVKYRKIDYQKGDAGSKEWCEANRKPILFGMNHCNPNNPTLVITEGQIDSLSLVTAGIENAVSVPIGKKGFTWIPHCWDFINQFEEIIVFGDREGEEITLLDEIQNRFRRLRIKAVRVEDYLGEKDANDILLKHGAEMLKTIVDNAQIIHTDKILDAADVKDIDPDSVERVPTGFGHLDKMLDGGLPTGGVSIISGYTGEGKSTFAQQLVLNSVAEGYKSLVYSGELSNELLKSWLLRQAAGADYIETYKDEKSGAERYRIEDITKLRINRWMRDKLYIFDNRVTDANELVSLPEVIRRAVSQYGLKVVLVDNLMTAIDLNARPGSDVYEEQGRFVNELVQISIEYKILIILVAHRKKNGSYLTDDNEGIMGSSRIANLCAINIYYGKDANNKSNPTANDERKIRIGKNRITGETTEDGIKVKFEKSAKRIYEDTRDGYRLKERPIGWNRLTKKEVAE